MYSPLWKITHHTPSVLCTPPFEKPPIKAHRFCVLPPLKNHCIWWAFISGWAFISANMVSKTLFLGAFSVSRHRFWWVNLYNGIKPFEWSVILIFIDKMAQLNSGLHLHNAMIKCGTIYNSPSENDDYFNDLDQCSDECQISLLELERGTKEGRNYARCSCESDSTASNDSSGTVHHCEREKRAIFRCRTADPPADVQDLTSFPGGVPESRSVPAHLAGCNDARRYCEDSNVCRDSLHYYERVCESSPVPATCPRLHCLESYDILMRQEEAQFLRGCRCGDPAATPEPNVIYCFRKDYFSRCSLKEVVEREVWLQQGLAVNDGMPLRFSRLLTFPHLAAVYLTFWRLGFGWGQWRLFTFLLAAIFSIKFLFSPRHSDSYFYFAPNTQFMLKMGGRKDFTLNGINRVMHAVVNKPINHEDLQWKSTLDWLISSTVGKIAPRGWFPGGSKKWPNTKGQKGDWVRKWNTIARGQFQNWPKEKIPKEKIPKEKIPKGKNSKEEIPKEKIPKGKNSVRGFVVILS